MSAKRHADARRKGRYLGRTLKRLEDLPLVTGRGRFVDDISFRDQLHMRVVRSQYAHGRIVSIDASAALALEGVLAVWTGADIAHLPPINFRDAAAEALKPYRQPALARDKVRYVGEPVAAVFAESPYTAEDAAALVDIEIEELPPLMNPTALGEFAPSLSTEPVVLKNAYGDIDAQFEKAAHVIELELSIGRHSGVPMEARGALANYDAGADIL